MLFKLIWLRDLVLIPHHRLSNFLETKLYCIYMLATHAVKLCLSRLSTFNVVVDKEGRSFDSRQQLTELQFAVYRASYAILLICEVLLYKLVNCGRFLSFEILPTRANGPLLDRIMSLNVISHLFVYLWYVVITGQELMIPIVRWK